MCDFTYDLCGWHQVSGTAPWGGDQFDWSRKSGSTSSANTGPRGDHTTGRKYTTVPHKQGLREMLVIGQSSVSLLVDLEFVCIYSYKFLRVNRDFFHIFYGIKIPRVHAS